MIGMKPFLFLLIGLLIVQGLLAEEKEFPLAEKKENPEEESRWGLKLLNCSCKAPQITASEYRVVGGKPPTSLRFSH